MQPDVGTGGAGADMHSSTLRLRERVSAILLAFQRYPKLTSS
ncbi:hypothetical protein [Allomesorhizobium alhagi]|jgi:hypothetical protein|uniref:Uncharacterized protein n=1 Tax=Mesorhizobium alhagi CCNWXJ12-2 TaxID=1107882 RepID=H0HU43_9HYPH|nr:hypothetical protein [Mesorhizobium alhagi]EHK55679.1 hypothetical protein MAXJ12_18423 [Mesorhizobium alhagi CCNWXJ12-2]